MPKATLLPVGLLTLAMAVSAHAAPVQCPHNGHYYELVDTPMTWADADAAAQSMTYLGFTGHLITVTDEDEHNWFRGFLASESPNNHVHMGGFQDPGGSEPGGGWQWVTGEPMTYTKWYPGEPNQYLGNNEDHMFGFRGNESYRGEWADGLGSNNFWFVVEYDYTPPVPLETVSWGLIKTRP